VSTAPDIVSKPLPKPMSEPLSKPLHTPLHRARALVSGCPWTTVEPLIPSWAVWFYVLSPPLLALMLHPELVEQDSGTLTRTLLATWIHTVCIGASLHALYTWGVPWVLQGVTRRASRLAIHAVGIVLGTAAGLAVSVPVALLTCDWGPRRPWWELYTSLVISTCFVVALVTYTQLRKRARDVELRAERAQQAELQSRLASLTARTNPHFLFNSLNTVAGLIGEDPDRAEEAVERLSDLFRYTLDASSRSWVRLQREIDAVNDYLLMEGLRYEDRLAFDVSVDDAAAVVPVPPLVIQPLVENAIRHGIEGRGHGCVEVTATCLDDQLIITVVDDGPGPGASMHTGSQTSLADLRQRLELLFGNKAELRVAKHDDGGCVVTLSLPVGAAA